MAKLRSRIAIVRTRGLLWLELVHSTFANHRKTYHPTTFMTQRFTTSTTSQDQAQAACSFGLNTHTTQQKSHTSHSDTYRSLISPLEAARTGLAWNHLSTSISHTHSYFGGTSFYTNRPPFSLSGGWDGGPTRLHFCFSYLIFSINAVRHGRNGNLLGGVLSLSLPLSRLLLFPVVSFRYVLLRKRVGGSIWLL